VTRMIMKSGHKQIVAPESEAKLQARVIAHLRAHGKPGLVFYAVPNGGKRDGRSATLLQAQGVVAGIPDIALICDGLPYFLELKTATGRLSDVQRTMLEQLVNAKAICAVAYSFEDARAILQIWELTKC
jgi:hypothetical protein